MSQEEVELSNLTRASPPIRHHPTSNGNDQIHEDDQTEYILKGAGEEGDTELTDILTGLGTRAAQKRLEVYGYNVNPHMIAQDPSYSAWPVLSLTAHSLASGLLSMILYVTLSIIAYNWWQVLSMSILLGFFMLFALLHIIRWRSVTKHMKKMLQLRSRVLRSGIWMDIPSRELVPGDIIELSPGKIVPAKCLVRECSDGLIVDYRSMLTDKSIKTDISEALDSAVMQIVKNDILLAGAMIKSGEAYRVQVLLTGPDAFFHHNYDSGTVSHLRRARRKDLVYSATRSLMYLVTITFVIAIAAALLTSILSDRPLAQVLSTASFLIVIVAVHNPVGLVLRYARTEGARRVASAAGNKRGAVLHSLATVELLASMSTIAVDTRGYLTSEDVRAVKLIPMQNCTASGLLISAALSTTSESQAASHSLSSRKKTPVGDMEDVNMAILAELENHNKSTILQNKKLAAAAASSSNQDNDNSGGTSPKPKKHHKRKGSRIKSGKDGPKFTHSEEDNQLQEPIISLTSSWSSNLGNPSTSPPKNRKRPRTGSALRVAQREAASSQQNLENSNIISSSPKQASPLLQRRRGLLPPPPTEISPTGTQSHQLLMEHNDNNFINNDHDDQIQTSGEEDTTSSVAIDMTKSTDSTPSKPRPSKKHRTKSSKSGSNRDHRRNHRRSSRDDPTAELIIDLEGKSDVSNTALPHPRSEFVHSSSSTRSKSQSPYASHKSKRKESQFLDPCLNKNLGEKSPMLINNYERLGALFPPGCTVVHIKALTEEAAIFAKQTNPTKIEDFHNAISSNSNQPVYSSDGNVTNTNIVNTNSIITSTNSTHTSTTSTNNSSNLMSTNSTITSTNSSQNTMSTNSTHMSTTSTFTSTNTTTTTASVNHHDEIEKGFIVASGDPRSVILYCVEKENILLVSKIEEIVAHQCSRARRVIAVAKGLAASLHALEHGPPSNLNLVGLITFESSVLPDTHQALADLWMMGVDLKFMSNSSVASGAALSEQLSIGESVITVEDYLANDPIRGGSGVDLNSINGFAEVTPENQIHIALATSTAEDTSVAPANLQPNAEPSKKDDSKDALKPIWGLTSNDPSVLYEADIGITDRSSPDVAIQSADVIVLEPGMRGLVAAISQARQCLGVLEALALCSAVQSLRNIITLVAAWTTYGFQLIPTTSLTILVGLNVPMLWSVAQFETSPAHSKPPSPFLMRKIAFITFVLTFLDVSAAFFFSILVYVFKFRDINANEANTCAFLWWALSNGFMVLLTRSSRGLVLFKPWPHPAVLVICLASQIIASLLALFGWGMTKIGIINVLLVWVYVLAFFIGHNLLHYLAIIIWKKMLLPFLNGRSWFKLWYKPLPYSRWYRGLLTG